jgi:hypothetical protein
VAGDSDVLQNNDQRFGRRQSEDFEKTRKKYVSQA